MFGTGMRAIVQTGRETIEIQELPEPEPAADEVLIRVHCAGLCGSDVHAYEYAGGFEWVTIPRVMGHEYTGDVVAVGESVDDVAVGDTVVEEPIHPCGDCFQCRNDERNVCQDTTLTGMETDGAFREYTTVSAEFVHRVPETIPSERLAITEPLSIATRAVYERSEVTPGDNVLVEGPGPIGALIAAVAAELGANVTVSGIGKDSTHRLPLLAELGVETVDVSATETSLADATDAATDGLGFDTVFDSTGHHTGIPTGVDVVRKGGDIVIVGLPDGASELSFTPVVRGEIDLVSSYGALWSDFERSVRLLETDRLDLAGIVDTGYSVTDPQEAIDDFRAARTIKPVFAFT
jgi:L-iditol 2-dehydrogenase